MVFWVDFIFCLRLLRLTCWNLTLRFYQPLRVCPTEKSTSMGKISRRPASILKIRTSLESGLKTEKLQVGPMTSKPGPMLLKVEITADILVISEKPSKETRKKLTIRIST